MRGLILIAACLMLSGCINPLTGKPDAVGTQLLGQIITDPACGHDDKVHIITGAGGIPGSFEASAERHCPMPTNIVTVAPGSVVSSTAHVKK